MQRLNDQQLQNINSMALSQRSAGQLPAGPQKTIQTDSVQADRADHSPAEVQILPQAHFMSFYPLSFALPDRGVGVRRLNWQRERT